MYDRRKDVKYRPPLYMLVPGYVPLTAAKPAPAPPCGGDCRNCPYETCRYPAWEEEHPVGSSPADRARARRKYLKRKARMEADPALAEEVHARRRGYAEKRRAKIKFVKAGGSPEEFERRWADGRQDHAGTGEGDP